MGDMITLVENIKCPAVTAFDLMADARNELRWNTGISKAELVSGEPIGKGARFRVADKRGQHDAVITAYIRPEVLSFSVNDPKMDVLIDIAFSERDNVTTMTSKFNAKGKGMMKFLLPFLVPLIRRDLSREHMNFVKLCEAKN